MPAIDPDAPVNPDRQAAIDLLATALAVLSKDHSGVASLACGEVAAHLLEPAEQSRLMRAFDAMADARPAQPACRQVRHLHFSDASRGQRHASPDLESLREMFGDGLFTETPDDTAAMHSPSQDGAPSDA